MAEFPSGTVTFVFTDVEGSTALLQAHGEERYAGLLAEHRRLLREAFACHAGAEVDTQGDAFFFVFARASDALAGAEEGQRALESTPVRVRIGIHTGEPVLTSEGYVGLDVHKAARIAAAGHGGQVLLSEQSARLAGCDRLVDLGPHRLKDLSTAEHIYQLGVGQFPPLKTLYQTYLPVPANPLVGRKQELGELVDLLQASRLVTLTGPGGTGKTRLAVEAAAGVAGAFPDGVYWVSLQAVTDSELMLPTVASSIGAKGELYQYVGEKRMLILVDNVEQLLPEAARPLSELIAACPNVGLLVTSRAPLRIAAERECHLEPLPLGDAVTLFRARAVNAEPIEAVFEICRRVDGLPLGVELAAARTRLLPPVKLLARLERALPVLTSGSRDAPERQRTLRATIAWSYELLSAEEQHLFRRLSVFAGSFELEAAEEVAAADLDTLESLIEHNLVRRRAGDRLGVLETIREYAMECLEESAEAEELRRRHAEFMVARVAEAAEALVGERRASWYDALEDDYANVRSALTYLVDRDRDVALKCAADLWPFWSVRGYLAEARFWFDDLLADDEREPDARARALNAAANVARLQGDLDAADELTRRLLELSRVSGAQHDVIRACTNLASIAAHRGDLQGAIAHQQDAVSAAQSFDDARPLAVALVNLGYFLTMNGDSTSAVAPLTKGLSLHQHDGDLQGQAAAHLNLGGAYLLSHRDDDARSAFAAALHLSQQLAHREFIAYALQGIAAATASAEPERAATLLGTSRRLLDQVGARPELLERQIADNTLEAISNQLRGRTETAIAAGIAASLEEAVQIALDT